MKNIHSFYAFQAEKIDQKNTYDNFMDYYSKLCGGISPRRGQVGYYKYEKESYDKSNAEYLLIKQKCESSHKNQEKFSDELKTQNDRQEKMSARLSAIRPVSFTITGEVYDKSGSVIMIFGHAVPQGNGITVVNGNVVLHGYKQEDIVTPRGYSPAAVYTQAFYYSHEAKGKNRFGNNISIYHFTRTPPGKYAGEIKRLEAGLKNAESQIKSLSEKIETNDSDVKKCTELEDAIKKFEDEIGE